MNDFCIQMSLLLISIPGCDSKSRTISVWPLFEAKSNGVLLNIEIQFHEWFKMEIWWNNSIQILSMIFYSNVFAVNFNIWL